MANYDKDGDATMETQSLTEKELQQQLATTIGQKVSIAVQNSTDIGAATSIFAGISVSSPTNVRVVSSKIMVACD